MPIRRIKGTFSGLPMEIPVAYTFKQYNTKGVCMLERYKEDNGYGVMTDVVDATTFSGKVTRITAAAASIIDGYICIARKGGRHDFKSYTNRSDSAIQRDKQVCVARVAYSREVA